MRHPYLLAALATVALLPAGASAQHMDHAAHAQTMGRLNPMITLMEQGKPVFGLYAPAARPRGASPDTPGKSPAELAAETLGFPRSDFVFDGSMEYGVEQGLPPFKAFVAALQAAGATTRTSPLVVKMTEIAPDPAAAQRYIAQQLNTGVSTIMFVGVESADEVRTGLAAMRFRSHGGTRPDDIGAAPAYWGVSESEYRAKADLWPLNPEGELVNWTIVESKEGLAHVREIAAVEGIGVLWPGAGTLRQVFSSTDANGQRVLDAEAWENAIQTVLAACKEFEVPCGYPANADDIEMRMAQGFSVFVMGWGERGFETIDIGRRASGR
ncbi:MAG: aldolase/citrate lyase family protein [Gemmatimonadota bacterium]